MIGNPFCTIKVFWNFHTKNRLAQVRHIIFGKIGAKATCTNPEKRRYSKNSKKPKDGNAVYIVLLAAIPAAVLLALLLVFLYRKKRKAQDNPPAGGKDPSEPDGGNTKN